MTLKHSLLSIVAVLLLGTGVSRAGINSWTLTGPEGGSVTALAVHPTDASVMLVSAGNGMYRSADGGLTWVRAGVGGWANNIVFDPANPNRVFVAARYIGLYRSDDAGQTFAVMPGPANTTPQSIAISGDSTLYMLDSMRRVFRSTDMGASWVQTASGWSNAAELTAIAVQRAQSNVVYVAVKGVGILKSTDSGASWSAPQAGSPGTASADNIVFQIAIKPDDPERLVAATREGVFVTLNGGTAWSNALTTYGVQWISFDPAANNNAVAVGWVTQIYRSDDGGITWPTDLRGPDLMKVEAPQILFAPGNKLVVATSDGPMVSTDGGATFALRVSGMRAQGIGSFSTAADGVMYATFYPGPFGLYRHEGDWQPVDNAALRSRLNFPAFRFAAVAPGNSRRLFAFGISGTADLISSNDAGLTWTTPHTQFANGTTVLMRVVVDPTNEQVVYVLTQNSGVWKSVNGGFSYAQHTTGLPTAVSALTVDRTNPQVLYAGGHFDGATGVFKSTNGGQSWAATGALPDQPVLDIVLDPANSSVVYAVLNLGIHKSVNGGNTWTRMNLPGASTQISARGLLFDPRMPTTMFVANNPDGPGFARSVDSGATWQNVPWSVLPGLGSLDVFSLDGLFENVVLAGGRNTGLYAYHVANNLRLNFTSPPVFALGATGSLTIPYENLGPFDAAAPQLWIRVPPNLTITVPAGCTFDVPDDLRCTMPALRSGASANLTLPYSASATAANEVMSVLLFGRELELDDTNNRLGASVSVQALANVAVTTLGTVAVQRDGAVTYTASVTNIGPNASAVTTLVIQVPAGITVQTATPSVGTCTATGVSRTCELGVLASGVSASVAVQGTATVVGDQAWSSTVSTSAQDLVAGNNTATLTTTVTAPPPPPPTGGSSSGGGGGGGGRFDWLVLALLGGVLLRKWGHS